MNRHLIRDTWGEKKMWKAIRAGIRDGRRAFCGPRIVQIDLTDTCNNSCAGCWVHSPLLDKEKVFPQGEQRLPLASARKLIEELSRMGTREIILSGSGEPLVYPGIREIVRLITAKGIYLNIITNGLLLDASMARFLTETRVNLLTVSVWAGDRKTYVLTHPEKAGDDFDVITNGLKAVAYCKKNTRRRAPHIKIYNVICSKNHTNIDTMVDYAKAVDADSIEFQVIDIMRGVTDSLALDDACRQSIMAQFLAIAQRKDLIAYDTPLNVPIEKFMESEFLDFGKIWKNPNYLFSLKPRASNLMCRKDKFGRRYDVSDCSNPESTRPVTYRYRFSFDRLCRDCALTAECFGKKSRNKRIDVKLLNILGAATFLRRVNTSFLEAQYDHTILDKPCYMGWYYARVVSNGNVIPCCKGAGHPLGNINRDAFSRIWYSSSYDEFRNKAKVLTKSDPYFSHINCLNVCDNRGMNIEVEKRMQKAALSRLYPLRRNHFAPRHGVIFIKASDFSRGNLNPRQHGFGNNLVIDGGSGCGFAEYDLIIRDDSRYVLYSRYASGACRPVSIFIDEKLVKENGLSNVTGGWTIKHTQWFEEMRFTLTAGFHQLKIYTKDLIPHLHSFLIVDEKECLETVPHCHGSALSRIKQRIDRKGVLDTVRAVRTRLKPGYLKDRNLEILGVYDGSYAYKGPYHVQIDLTDDCNNTCIGCWCNSPLLPRPASLKKNYLPFLLVKELLDDLARLRVEEIYYSGGGEPFMHPQIMEILEYTKKKKFTCHVNTNFTLVDKRMLDELIRINVDFLTVSLWAATPETYVATHPNRKADDFVRIKENLSYLNTKKVSRPYIKLYNVLFNLNYHEAERMVDLAAQTRCESLEFTLIDTIPQATDSLVLTTEQTTELVSSCSRIRSALSKDGKTSPDGVLIFQFDQFLRRISVAKNVTAATYDKNIIDSIPCYAGWLFARVVATGDVHSCLKAHRIPTGSLYRRRFEEIWNSKEQINFRKKTFVYEKRDPFFRNIGNDVNTKEAGCYKSCDDIGRNTWMHERLTMLSFPEKALLKSLADISRRLRNFRVRNVSVRKNRLDPVIRGILHGRKAFTGPKQVVIDPTNQCDMRCISCWLYSPLLTQDKPSLQCLNSRIPQSTLLSLIDDLASLGTERIRFSGGGEPLCHQNIFDVIKYARTRKLRVSLTTNFVSISKDAIRQLIDLGVDELCVSICAGDSATYQKVHPGMPLSCFERLEENLRFLKEIKNGSLHLTIAHVIMNVNADNLRAMYDLARQYGADALYFTLVDVLAGQTDTLLLSRDQQHEILKEAGKIRTQSVRDKIDLHFFDGFLARLTQVSSSPTGSYDSVRIDSIPCYAGWFFSRVLADGSVVPCCRGVKKNMGNIKTKSFREIWFSPSYDEFRTNAKYRSKKDDYFSEIECTRECDNFMHNQDMDKQVRRVCRMQKSS